METGKNGKIQLEVSWLSLWRAVLFFNSLFLLLAKRYRLGGSFIIVISSALNPLISWLEKRRIPRVFKRSRYIYSPYFINSYFTLYYLAGSSCWRLMFLLRGNGESGYSIIPVLGLEKLAEISGAFTESIGRLASVLFSGGTSLFDTLSKFLGGNIFVYYVFCPFIFIWRLISGVEAFTRPFYPRL